MYTRAEEASKEACKQLNGDGQEKETNEREERERERHRRSIHELRKENQALREALGQRVKMEAAKFEEICLGNLDRMRRVAEMYSRAEEARKEACERLHTTS